MNHGTRPGLSPLVISFIALAGLCASGCLATPINTPVDDGGVRADQAIINPGKDASQTDMGNIPFLDAPINLLDASPTGDGGMADAPWADGITGDGITGDGIAGDGAGDLVPGENPATDSAGGDATSASEAGPGG